MATYDEIYGKRVEVLDADPTLNSAYEGQVWYNSSTGALKSVVSFSAWVSSANINQGRSSAGGNGIQDAALMCGGYVTGEAANTEEYNGSGWINSGALNTARYALRSAGTQTSAIAFGGYTGTAYHTTSETYNGSSWTNGPAINTGRSSGSPAGTSTAALYAGGGIPGTVNNSEEYNGSSWSEGNNLNTARTGIGGSGIQTAALAAGGELGPPGYTGATELYDGTSWTTSPASLNVIKGGQGQSGTQTSSLAYGGYTGTAVTGATESWDGTTWTNLSPVALSVSRNATQGAGADSKSAVCFGGDPQKADTEEYNKSINTITASAWSSGANLNTGRSNVGACGSKTAGLAIQGETSTDVNNVEEYDGSSWANATAHPEAKQSACAVGLQTAAISLGGYPLVTTSASYDGTNWTSAPALTVANANWSGGGPSTACFGIGGGEAPSPSSGKYHDQYDGSSWTSATNMSTTRVQCAAFGAAQNAILATGGRANTPGAPSTRISSTESWNGSSWTAGPSMTSARSGHLAFGTQTAGIIQAGSTNPGSTTLTSQNVYDGTSYATGANNSDNHGGLGGTGGTTAPLSSPTANSFMTGGPSQSKSTEEFNLGTTVVTAKTLTTS